MASRQLLARALLARGGNLAPAQQQLLRPIRCFSKNRDNDFNNKNDDVQYQYTRAELNMIRDGKTERVMNEELDSLSAKEEVDEDPFASPLAMDTDDVFGLRVTDEQAKTGFASLAPNYKRDRATGKLMMKCLTNRPMRTCECCGPMHRNRKTLAMNWWKSTGCGLDETAVDFLRD
jgi:hypothetical protein